MKRALFLAYDFPPCKAPGAAVRSVKFARYLTDFGWQATVVSRDEGLRAEGPEGSPIVRIPPPVTPRISYQLAAWLWALRVVTPAAELLRAGHFDLIYATCPPFPHSLAALSLSRKTGLPLVVDLRDPWSLDPYGAKGWAKGILKRALCSWVYPIPERRVLEGAAAVIVNTPSMQREYARMLGWSAERIHLLPNGYDEADFSGDVAPVAGKRPVFLYCGRFGEVAGRDPGLLLRAARALRDRGVDIDFRIVGDDSVLLRKQVARLGLAATVTVRASVPHREAIREIRGADVLVVCQPNTPHGISSVAGKTFEYLRSGQPILAVVPPGDNADLVRAHAPTHEVVTSFELDDVIRAMESCARRVGGSAVRSDRPPAEFARRHERRALTGRLAEVFEAVTA